MPEILLHYIWQKRLFQPFLQHTTDGRVLEILSVGEHNLDAGPDFSNVHIRLDGVELVGNVEMHVSSSDWYHHRHHTDPAYDAVILHVVRQADKKVYNSHGEAILQCELQYPQNEDYLSRWIEDAQRMDSAWGVVNCGKKLLSDPQLLSDGWRKVLLKHRLECKTQSVHRLLALTHNGWEQAFYITLAHCFGFHTNGIPFEQLAIQTPLSYLQKHRNSLFQLTAILLGQSGLLNAENSDETEEKRLLFREYSFLQKKFSLEPIPSLMWKRARMRPQNAPEARVRQFAQLLFQSEFLFSRLMETKDIDDLIRLLTPLPSEDTGQVLPVPKMGVDSVRVLIINAVVPYLYAKGKQQQAFHILSSLPAEDNRIIRQWQLLGQQVRSAADSQALIHLYQNYCQHARCLNCDVAYQIFLTNTPLPTNL